MKKADTKTTKSKKKQVVEEAVEEAADKKAPVNQTKTNYSNTTFGCTRKNALGKDFNLKIASWNVDGVRAWLKKEGLQYILQEDPDILCLQETKCADGKLPDEIKNVDKYKSYWCASEKDGYAGVALFSKIEPLSVKYGIGSKEHDDEGRCITAEYEKFYLVNVYVPNAG